MIDFTLPIQFLGLIIIAAFGGVIFNIYSGHLSFWKKLPPEDFLNWYSNYSSGIIKSTSPLDIISIAILIISVILVWNVPQSRIYWVISLFLIVGIIVITMLYYIKTNSSFSSRTIELSEIRDNFSTWGRIHIVCISMAFFASITAGIGIIKYIQNT